MLCRYSVFSILLSGFLLIGCGAERESADESEDGSETYDEGPNYSDWSDSTELVGGQDKGNSNNGNGSLRGDSIVDGRGPASIPNEKSSIADQIAALKKGKLEYEFPTRMKVGDKSEIVVAIGRDTLAKLLRPHDPQDTSSLEEREAIIPVGEYMTVNLEGDTSLFDISKTSEHDDPIPFTGSGRWVFTVTPKRAGVYKLFLRVYVNLEGKQAHVDDIYPIYEAELEVESNPMRSFLAFIDEHWKWIITIIIIPFLAWAWKEWKDRDRPNKT